MTFTEIENNISRNRLRFTNLWLSVPLVLSFSLVDFIYYKKFWLSILLVRITVIIPFMFIEGIYRSNLKLTLKNNLSHYILVVFLANYNLYIINLVEDPYSYYFHGLNLLTIGVFSFIPMTHKKAMFSSLLIYAPYFIYEIFHSYDSNFKVLFGNIAFCISTLLISFATGYFSKLLRYNNYRSNKEKDELKAELINQEKLSSIGLVSAGIAHQLGNTINVISTSNIAQKRMLAKGKLNNELLMKCQKNIEDAVYLSKEIISSVNSLSKENDVFKNNNLKSIINAAIVVAKGQSYESVEYLNNVDTETNVLCSKSSLIQVFMNLFSNSIDALPKSGGTIKIDALDNGEFIHIYVNDNGSGIPPETIKLIFNEFVTTKSSEKGTGLGLYIVKKEVERNKGNISVESSPGNTTFKIILKQELS